MMNEINKLTDQNRKNHLINDRLKLQLEQKKTQLALIQEKQAENELELKKKMKVLLENFLKVRDENRLLYDSIQKGIQLQEFSVCDNRTDKEINDIFINQNFMGSNQMQQIDESQSIGQRTEN